MSTHTELSQPWTHHSPFTTWVEIDLDAIVHNYRQVRELVGDSVKVLGVIKANAYGHGMVEVAQVLEGAGIDYLGVTRLEEGIELRAAGIAAPILVFSPPLPDQIESALCNRLTLTVDSVQLAEQISQTHLLLARDVSTTRVASSLHPPSPAPVHLKLDTGMGRLGFRCDEVAEAIQRIVELGGVRVEGVYTHFANAQERDASPALSQLHRFRAVVDSLAGAIPLIHCANSAATVRFPESHFGMVGVGNLLYGQNPVEKWNASLDLRNTFEWKARVVSVRHLRKGETVGYGSEWRAPHDCAIATLPVGFADGFEVEIAARAPSINGSLKRMAREVAQVFGVKRPSRWFRLGNHNLPTVGRIGMQQCSVLLPQGLAVEAGAVVTVPTRRLAVSSRVPRVFIPAQREKR